MQRTVVVKADDEVKRVFEWKRGLVSFVSEPPGAEIYYKNQRVGTLEDRTPFEWEFPEGDYEFSAVLPKTEIPGVTAQWSVRADVENEALFAFGYGSVAIRTDPAGATVLTGDKAVGTTPFVKTPDEARSIQLHAAHAQSYADDGVRRGRARAGAGI